MNNGARQTRLTLRALTPLYLAALLAAVLIESSLAQPALTWPELREKFEASNPTLTAARIGIDESKAAEVTAYLRPNPNITGVFDQIDPFTKQPPVNGSGGDSYNPFRFALPSGSIDYLHERQHKRELAGRAPSKPPPSPTRSSPTSREACCSIYAAPLYKPSSKRRSGPWPRKTSPTTTRFLK